MLAGKYRLNDAEHGVHAMFFDTTGSRYFGIPSIGSAG